MLSVHSYSGDYIDACEQQMRAQLDAYALLAAAATASGASGASVATSFEIYFFGNLVLVLDRYFVHRTRALEGRDGNALNEVRMIGASLLHHGGVLTAEKSIKYVAARSATKVQIGDRIFLTDARFRTLCDAYFAEMRHRYT